MGKKTPGSRSASDDYFAAPSTQNPLLLPAMTATFSLHFVVRFTTFTTVARNKLIYIYL
jgi:hypothetical protein